MEWDAPHSNSDATQRPRGVVVGANGGCSRQSGHIVTGFDVGLIANSVTDDED